MNRVEYSHSRGQDVHAFASLAEQAGLSLPELVDNIDTGGLPAALRHAAGRAGRRNRDPRRKLLELLSRSCP